MDTDLLKTFLEVRKTRHFGRAADNLFITQSAVSARIKLLEDQLGVQLFSRARNNIRLTDAGEKFIQYAEAIVTVLSRARSEIGIATSGRASLSVGAVSGVWDVFLSDWLAEVYRAMPGVVLSANAYAETELVRRVYELTLDIAFVFDSVAERDLAAVHCAEIPVVMVSSEPGLAVEQAIGKRYIFVDWGTRAAILHAQHFPNLSSPILRTGLGRVAKSFLLSIGGSAYLAANTVQDDLNQGRLHRVANAPMLSRVVYAVYSLNNERRAGIETALRVTEKKFQSVATRSS